MAKPTLRDLVEGLPKHAGLPQQMGSFLRGGLNAGRQFMQNQGEQKALGSAMQTLQHAGQAPSFLGNAARESAQAARGGASGPGLLSHVWQGATAQGGKARQADQALDRFRQVQQGEQMVQQARGVAGQHGIQLPSAPNAPNYSGMQPHEYMAMHGVDPMHHAPKPQGPGLLGKVDPVIPMRPMGDPSQGGGQTPPTQALQAPQPVAQASGTPPTAFSLASQKVQQQGQGPGAPDQWGSARDRLGLKAQQLGRRVGDAAQRYALPAAGAGALGYAGYRGMQSMDEQDARTRDLMAARQQDLTAPMPSMSVYASYDEFADAKLAADQLPIPSMYQTAHSAAAGSIAKSLTDQLVARPLDALGGLIQKKFYTQPKQHKTFDHVTQSDPMIAQAYAQKPEQVHEAYKVMKDFGPSLSTNPSAVKSFLRQAIMANGDLDYATIRMLAETEKFIQNGRGRGT